jgi:Uma2 family endonuclease
MPLSSARAHGGICLHAPLDIVFSDHNVLQPDVIYFGADRKHLVDPLKVIRHPPDLCIEILSPSTAQRDRGRKMQTFARFHVQEYGLVDPSERMLEQYELEGDSYRIRAPVRGDDRAKSPLLPAFALRVGDIFQDLE